MAGWVAFAWEDWEPLIVVPDQDTHRPRIGDFLSGLPGMIVDMQTAEKISRIPETDIEFGTAVLAGNTGDAYCQAASFDSLQAGMKFLGIAMRDMTSAGGIVDLGQNVYAVYDNSYRQGSWCASIIQVGLVWVVAQGNVKEGDPVAVLPDGTFTTSATPDWAVSNAKWATSAPAGMLAVVALNIPSITS